MILTLLNHTPSRVLFLLQTGSLRGRVAVDSGGRAEYHGDPCYAVRAELRQSGLRYETSLALAEPWGTVTALHREGQNRPPLELQRAAVGSTAAVTCENLTAGSVSFVLARSVPPLTGAALVDSLEQAIFPTDAECLVDAVFGGALVSGVCLPAFMGTIEAYEMEAAPLTGCSGPRVGLRVLR